jgi:hypothetical protein
VAALQAIRVWVPPALAAWAAASASSESPSQTIGAPPFDATRLDQIMDEKHLDVLVICSKHNSVFARTSAVFLL